MSFRAKYKKAVRVEFSRKTHIHHIDKNRKNNSIENLVHVNGNAHLIYHYYIVHVNDLIHNLRAQELTITKSNINWVTWFSINKNWAKKLLSAEKKLLYGIKIRNKRTGIKTIPEFITKEQREIIEICIKKPKL